MGIDKSTDNLAESSPKFFGFLKITKQDFPCICPSGAYGFLESIYQLSECLNILCSRKCFSTDFSRFIRIIAKSTDQSFRGHPLILQRIIEAMCSIDDITLNRFIHAVGSFSQGATGNSRLKKLSLKFNGRHISILN